MASDVIVEVKYGRPMKAVALRDLYLAAFHNASVWFARSTPMFLTTKPRWTSGQEIGDALLYRESDDTYRVIPPNGVPVTISAADIMLK